MIRVYKPPFLHAGIPNKSIFLAGSIEMGLAEDWQNELIGFLQSLDIDDVDVFNPRRDDWDSTWAQEASNPQFHEQVTWELDHLELADVKSFYFDPNTKSPVTVLELGLMLSQDSDKCVVCCPHGFWRRGNIEITCARHNVRLLDNMTDFKQEIAGRLQ